MSSPAVSIVMTTYNRAPLLYKTLESIREQVFSDYEVIIVDDGNDRETSEMLGLLCVSQHDWYKKVTYIQLNRSKYAGYNNPAYPNNVGLRMATGDLIILQNAECRYVHEHVLDEFIAATGPSDAVMGCVQCLDAAGAPLAWYVHPAINPRPFFFCGALRREWFHKLRGFDEDYTYYGMEDVDFADRLVKAGVRFKYSDIPIQHQWHGESLNHSDPNNNIPILLYHQKVHDMAVGKIGIERNLNKEWGEWPISKQ